MKVKIERRGYLSIERMGVFIPQLCPYRQEDVRCGDYCPLFHEPEPLYSAAQLAKELYDLAVQPERILLELCRTSLSIKKDDFTDEREEWREGEI